MGVGDIGDIGGVGGRGGRRRGTGRPRLPPEGLRRRSVCFRATEAEHRTVKRRAGLARLAMAAYVRACALRRAAAARPVASLNVRMYGQLGRLANNLNQLTKLVHQGRLASGLAGCLAELLAEVRALRRRLVGLDGGGAGRGDGGAEGGGGP